MENIHSVAIIGGGVSGVVVALRLSELNIDSVLFEKESSVISGPPFCHLHAGGNLYPEISDEQCRVLMKQSIEMARLFPQAIDKRPTFISIPKMESYSIVAIEKRLEMLRNYYRELIEEDAENEILGTPEDYYKLYQEEDLKKLLRQPHFNRPNSPDEWMSNAIKLVDYQKLKMPVILVQEYGWNLFRLGAQVQLALQKTDKCTLKLNTKVSDIIDVRNENLGYNWELHTNDEVYKIKYLVNSTGFKTGELDALLCLNIERLIEFKAAYIAKWKPIPGLIPEMIFHGKRGTPHGMAQLTPYYGDYYQIHAMTENVTLFKNGLIKTAEKEAQPEFCNEIKKKLTSGWDNDEISQRTENAINYVSKFVPTFKSAEVAAPPLYGAQQVPGNDLTQRVGEVSFPTKFYARSEIVKASSALSVAHKIIAKIQEEKVIDSLLDIKLDNNKLLNSIPKDEIDQLASEIAVHRNFPKELSKLLIQKDLM